ncbi:type III polyketide synthase [Microbacteriaceae bacterium VKM Ac-2855]|nr:type III polyketide synthase [Microbacteriaceae bacterium VKM Ac-2855]
MTVHIRTIETAVPEAVLLQTRACDVFAGQPGVSRLGSRLITAAFDASAIDERHTVVDELLGGSGPLLADGLVLDPSTAVRNGLYTARAPELFVPAARAALTASGFEPDDVTHVITVSCTGFYAPGPDYDVVRRLGLRPSTQRFHLGFMGCYGAFPALRAAKAFCEADAGAVVLIACVELCTIHLSTSNDPEQIVATSVFADGAAAAIVTARPAPEGVPVLELDALESVLTPEGEQEMAWTIGDHGFEMRLSSYVPSIIGRFITGALEPLLGAETPADVPLWAVHPGGRSILDKVEAALELTEAQLAPSREVLRRYGNMSSATVLFILRDLLAAAGATDERVVAMAFGPGLTVETGLFTRRLSPRRAE